MNDNLENMRTILKEKNIKLSRITCCFTGHRPQSLPWKFNEKDERCLKMKEQLWNEIIKAIKNGYKTFISGMALGFDMICAEIVLELKKHIHLLNLLEQFHAKLRINYGMKKINKGIGLCLHNWIVFVVFMMIILDQNVCWNAIGL